MSSTAIHSHLPDSAGSCQPPLPVSDLHQYHVWGPVCHHPEFMLHDVPAPLHFWLAHYRWDTVILFLYQDKSPLHGTQTAVWSTAVPLPNTSALHEYFLPLYASTPIQPKTGTRLRLTGLHPFQTSKNSITAVAEKCFHAGLHCS